MNMIVRCAIRYNDKYLVIHRPDHNEWCFPGGKVDTNESLLDALHREVVEETGVQISNVEHAFTETFQVKGKQYVQHVYTATGQPPVTLEALYDAFDWVDRAPDNSAVHVTKFFG